MTVTHLEDFLVGNNLHWVILFRFHFFYSLTLWRSDAGRFSGHWSDHPEAVLHIKHTKVYAHVSVACVQAYGRFNVSKRGSQDRQVGDGRAGI